MEMSEVIRRRRTELGMSQADLGAAAGVDARQIRRYEAGQSQPVLSVAVAIAGALGISIDELAPNSRNDGAKDKPRATPVSVLDAVRADPGLDDNGRELLTNVYRWLVRQRRGSNGES
jgi:transcriptional regulator with XRE-family HTH domain